MDLRQINDSTSQPDNFASQEEHFFYLDNDIEAATEIAVDKRKLTKLEVKIKRFESDTELRGMLAKVFTTIIAFWLLSVILILTGNYSKFHLTDKVLIILLTTSSINVIGMMLIILKNLFPAKNITIQKAYKPKSKK